MVIARPASAGLFIGIIVGGVLSTVFPWYPMNIKSIPFLALCALAAGLSGCASATRVYTANHSRSVLFDLFVNGVPIVQRFPYGSQNNEVEPTGQSRTLDFYAKSYRESSKGVEVVDETKLSIRPRESDLSVAVDPNGLIRTTRVDH